MDAGALQRAFARRPGRIAAVIPVHLYGQAADLEPIQALARRHGAFVIEDCAQSHGARLGDRRLGSFGDLAAFSFYPTKNLGAFGDGGMICCDDPVFAERLRALREYGWRQRYVSDVAGVNSRLDALQAAILGARLPHLDDDNARRQAVAALYDAGLAGSELGLPVRRAGATHVFHQYVVRSSARDALRSTLAARGIATGIHYPVPVHLQKAYAGRIASAPGGLGESERAAGEVLSLPIYPEFSEEEARRVVAALISQAR
jgi:hypothetical protein